MVEHVAEAGADEGGDDRPGQRGVDVLIGDAEAPRRAEQELGAGQEPHRGADPVGGHRQGAEFDLDDWRVVEEGGAHDGLSR